MVVLSGFTASIVHLPPIFGYMMGGMLIGPSGLNMVSNVVQVGCHRPSKTTGLPSHTLNTPACRWMSPSADQRASF